MRGVQARRARSHSSGCLGTLDAHEEWGPAASRPVPGLSFAEEAAQQSAAFATGAAVATGAATVPAEALVAAPGPARFQLGQADPVASVDVELVEDGGQLGRPRRQL